jgi:hypothetical protein
MEKIGRWDLLHAFRTVHQERTRDMIGVAFVVRIDSTFCISTASLISQRSLFCLGGK